MNETFFEFGLYSSLSQKIQHVALSGWQFKLHGQKLLFIMYFNSILKVMFFSVFIQSLF